MRFFFFNILNEINGAWFTISHGLLLTFAVYLPMKQGWLCLLTSRLWLFRSAGNTTENYYADCARATCAIIIHTNIIIIGSNLFLRFSPVMSDILLFVFFYFFSDNLKENLIPHRISSLKAIIFNAS